MMEREDGGKEDIRVEEKAMVKEERKEVRSQEKTKERRRNAGETKNRMK